MQHEFKNITTLSLIYIRFQLFIAYLNQKEIL